MTQKDYEQIAHAVRLSRPVSKDMFNDGVYAAHHALDMFVHNFADHEINHNPIFKREIFCDATETPLNRFGR